MNPGRRRFLSSLLVAGLPIPAMTKGLTVYMLLFRGVTDAEKGFLAGLAEAGLHPTVIIRDCDRDAKKLPGFVDEIRHLRPDLIYAFGTTTALAVVGREDERTHGRFIRDLPLIFNIVADPVGAGLTGAMTGSGRNVTGVTHLAPLQSQLAVMRQVKKIKRLGFIYSRGEKNSGLILATLREQSRQGGFEVIAESFAADEVGGALHGLIARAPDFLYLPSDSSVIVQAGEICAASHAAGIPTFSATEEPVRQSGAFLGLVTPYFTAGKFAAYKARQILAEGKSPGVIPIESVTRFQLLVNIDSAHRLDLYPPVNLMRFAEAVRSSA